ncbi:receptor-interacting serine/threonine-protein kinase 2 [Gastrophryne carolinensis]
MSSGTSSQESVGSSPARCLGDNLCLQPEPASISSHLQIIPYHKLTDLQFINKGAYGTVHKGLHSDWRIPVAVKFFPTERHLLESERKKILKEAEILHKARFSYILPILGICYEEDNIGIVTEYMTSGSLNQLLYEEDPSPAIVWPLRFRILYEIALGVNFLHNLTPPLLHHDLKTPNILLDNEFHVKIADFGLSKWRMLSQSFSDHAPAGGTIVYMPPEMYEPNVKTSRGSVKHDMYSYAIIMWEVLSRKQPYEGATNPIQVMYTVVKGNRPDISNESLPDDIPHRDVFVSLMQSGWACDPNERPSFLKCLLEQEPIIRSYDEILILEGILHIKRAYLLPHAPKPPTVIVNLSDDKFTLTQTKNLRYSKPSITSREHTLADLGGGHANYLMRYEAISLIILSDHQWKRQMHPNSSTKAHHCCHVFTYDPQVDGATDFCIKLNRRLTGSPAANWGTTCRPPLPQRSSIVNNTVRSPVEATDEGASSSAAFLALRQVQCSDSESEEKPPVYDPRSSPQSVISLPNIWSPIDSGRGSAVWPSQQEAPCSVQNWVLHRRKQIVNQMTDACLNQCLDALISKMMILKEDYELIKSEPTRTAKVRRLMDTCDIKGESFASIIVRKLIDNRQNDLQPFPEQLLDY